ncbi:MAG: YbjN domain-containing protein [Lachnospiraceae bacterium]|nr:YbjN domain-containing protein [Lachnospiraceae bacterium]
MMDEKKNRLLELLEEQLKKDDDIGEMSVFTARELDLPINILRAEVTEFGPELVSILAEFFFLPVDNEDALYFSSVLTLSSSIPKEAVPDMAAAVAHLNYYVPMGCYALGEDDRTFIYKCTVPVRTDDDEDRQKDDMYRAVDASLMLAESFLNYLILVLNNEISVDEMLDMIRGSKNG